MGSSCGKTKDESPEKNENKDKAPQVSNNLERNINDYKPSSNNNNPEKRNENNGGNYKENEIKRAPDEEKVQALPHNYETILKDADSPIKRREEEKKVQAILKDADSPIKRREEEKKVQAILKDADSPIKRTEEEKKVQALPHNYEAILKDADSPIDNSSPEKIYEQLYGGVFLNKKKKKYWVEKKSHKNCFMLFARDLSIACGDDDKCWTWSELKETSTSNVVVDVAQLLFVRWIDINGKFDTKYLSPSTMYEVVFVVMVTNDSSGWHEPVKLKLILPDGNKQEKTEVLGDKPVDQWIEVHVGEFNSMPKKGGNIQFFLYENEILVAKRGFLVKGAIIRPKFS